MSLVDLPESLKTRLLWTTDPNGFLKVAALVVCCVSLRLFSKYTTWPATPTQLHLCLITTGGWILLLSFDLLGYALDENAGWDSVQEVCADVIGVVLHLTVGVIVIDDYQRYRHCGRRIAALTYGSLSIVTAALLAADAFFLCEGFNEMILE